MSSRCLLVTGGAGFIGTNFVHFWFRNHPNDRLVVLDALTYAGNEAGLAAVRSEKGFSFVKGDICDTKFVVELLTRHAVDTIVHFAAESHVDRSISGPDAFVQTNIVGTHSLLMAAREVAGQKRAGASKLRFHHISTDEVFGSLQADAPPFTEETAYAPNSPYAASKAASDHLVRAYHHTYGLPVVTTNCSNNYGPYQYPEKLIPLMLINALHGDALPVYGDGTNIRDWLYVEDHCRGIELALLHGVSGNTYNIGGSNERSNIELVKLLCEEIDRAFTVDPALAERFPRAPAAKRARTAELIKFVKDRPGHDWRYAIDAGRIERELKFRPAQSIESGLRKTVSWYLEHEDWWRPLLRADYQKWLATNYSDRARIGGS